MQAAGQPHARAGGGQHLLAVSLPPDRRGSAAGDCGAGVYGRHLSAGPAAAARRTARASACLRQREPDCDLPSGIPAARPAAKEGSLGRSADCDEGTWAADAKTLTAHAAADFAFELLVARNPSGTSPYHQIWMTAVPGIAPGA